jgi:hypothetical protein
MKLERKTVVLAAAAAVLGAAPAFAQVANGTPGNLVVNGSMVFVDASGNPSAQGGDHSAGDPAAQLTGWSFLNTASNAEYWVSFQGQASPDGGSYLGVQDLDAFLPRVNVQGVMQTISGLTVGDTYELSFWSMSNHDGHGFLQDWQVTFGGESATGQQTTPNADDFSGTWVQSTMSFTATSTSQALTFVAQYLPGSVPEMLNLDGVVLTQKSVSSVPEPASWAMLLAGLGGAMALARRRRAR